MLLDKISECGTRLYSTGVSVVIVSLTLLLFAGVGFASSASSSNANKDAQELMASAEVLRSTWKWAELRQAKEKYEEAILIWTSIFDYSNASLATLEAGNVCLVLSDLREALKLFRQAVLLAEKSGNRRAQGRALSQAGLVHSYMGDNELARKKLTKALAFLKVAENEPDPTAKRVYGEALSNMAEVIYSEGYFPKALDQFAGAGKFFTGDYEGDAKIHLFAGLIYGSLGVSDKALSEIHRALKLYRAMNHKAGEALALSAEGQFHSFSGHQEPAIELHRDAINIFQSIGDQLGEAIARNGLGQAYDTLNQSALALENYNIAVRQFEDVDALDFVAGMTFKLATFHQREGNHEQALEYYERCLRLSRAAGKLRNEANALSEIAIVYESQGRRDQAAKQNRKAKDFYKSIGDLRGLAIAMDKYGEFLFKTGHTQEALNAYREALPLSKTVGDKSILLTTHYNLARAHSALGDYESGLQSIEEAIHISEELRANVGSWDARASYFSGVRQYYDLCRDILMQLERVQPGKGFATRAFFISEESRARSLLDQVKESQIDIRDAATAELLKVQREVNGQIASLAQYQYDLSVSGRDSNQLSEVDNRINKLRAESQEIQAKLRARNPTQLPAEPVALKDLSQIQKELQTANATLLEYSLGDERSYLFAITSNSVGSYELLPRKILEAATREVYDLTTTRQSLNGSAAGYEAIIEAADNCYPEKAAQLSQMLLAPVVEQLGTKRLIVVTEGALQYVQFEALPVPGTILRGSETARLLIQTNEVVVIPSMSILMTMRSAKSRLASPGRIVAVMADPVFNLGDERVENGQLSPAIARATPVADQAREGLLRGGGPSRLVHASEEADAIAEAAPWGTTMVARGFDANRETAMSSRVSEYQIVHFATHGFLDSEHPELSGIVLSMVDQNGFKKSGLMTLHDIYSLDLAAELTVLSACQTALGKDIKGEGVVGLAYSFMSAGSKSVVASLWKVDDRATAILMSNFYKSMLREGVPPVAALRAAKLKMIEDQRWNSPYYWAGFVFQGDYQSRINIGNNSHLALALALLLSVMISCALIVFLRRRRRSSSAART
jgi:CHAT domain-containing protein/tetratricopeptide (TPR) repeat protein